MSPSKAVARTTGLAAPGSPSKTIFSRSLQSLLWKFADDDRIFVDSVKQKPVK